MCGIVGACAQRDVAPLLLAGLQHLEYRGYDSAGIAVITQTGLQRYRALGKVAQLEALLEKNSLQGSTGIAHTRWATHGRPSETNAHPHTSGSDIAIVHNGIVENYEILREKLIQQNYQFQSDTDTEIVAHLLHFSLSQGHSFLEAVHEVIKQFIYLEEGDIAEITRTQIRIFDHHLKSVDRPRHRTKVSHEMVTRGEYRHFMLKEIFEQHQAILSTLTHYIQNDQLNLAAFSPELLAILEKTKRVQIVACGTSFHAGLLAQRWFESQVRLPTRVEVASEWRYQTSLVEPDTLFIVISQSGETADTLAALKLAKTKNYLARLAICNVAESSMVRESDFSFLTFAGPEIGVASTKAFTTQLVNLFLLMMLFSRRHDLNQVQEKLLISQLLKLPDQIDIILSRRAELENVAQALVLQRHALFLGKTLHYPIALEGALKLKELTYIHAEAYPAGELKHGPLALVETQMPVIALVPQDGLTEKIKSNLQEVRARGAKVFVLTQEANKASLAHDSTVFVMPEILPVLSPMLYVIPLQLLAYEVAVLKGTDVDQPRNLAKSVTVE